MSLPELFLTINDSVVLGKPTVKPFRFESELVDQFTDFILSRLDLTVTHEIDSNHGIADMVVCSIIPENIESISKIRSNCAFALRELPYRKRFDAKSFIALTGYNGTYVKKILNEFYIAGYIKKGALKDTWIKTHQPRAISGELLAIEAKLKDWKKAIIQAKRYQLFAHTSWVLLDAAFATRAQANIKHFEANNIGLALFSTDGVFTIISRPKKQKPKSRNKFWKVNVEMAKTIDHLR